MHILQAVKIFPPPFGGIETIIDRLAQGLCRYNSEIHVDILATDPIGSSIETHYNGRLRIERIKAIAQFARTPIAASYWSRLRSTSADILHFHFPYPWAELSNLLAANNKPYIVTYHSDIVKQKYILKLWKPFMLKFLAGATKIIVASPHMVTSSPILSQIDPSKIIVIPFGLDTFRFAATEISQSKANIIRARYSPDKKPILFFLGRLVYYKGIHVLLDAVKTLDVRLIIGGDGPLKQTLEQQIKENNLEHKVHLIGQVSEADLPSFYQASDLFILPSIENSEAFGLVQLEAHASGVPVVSSDLPTGVTYLNQHGRTGLCCPAGNPEALALGIDKLLKDPKLRKSMAAYAQKRAIHEFDQSMMCSRYLDLYSEIIKSKFPTCDFAP